MFCTRSTSPRPASTPAPVSSNGDAGNAVGPELLTAREAEVMELLQAGRSNGEIAQALQVSVETVRTHARHVYRKLGVRTRRELRALSGHP